MPDPGGLARKVNAELKRQWESPIGYDPHSEKKIAHIEGELADIRAAIEDGLADTGWAGHWTLELRAGQDGLLDASEVSGGPP